MKAAKLIACSMVITLAACSSGDNDDSFIEDAAVSSDTAVSTDAEVVNGEEANPIVVADADADDANELDNNEDSAVSSEENTQAPPDFNINESAFRAIQDVAGYKPDQLAGVVPDLAQIVIATAIGSPEALDNGEFQTIDGNFSDPITATTRTQYQCAGGGTLIHETGELRLSNFSGSNFRDINQYQFEQCQFEVTSDRVAQGSYRATGILFTDSSHRSASRGGEASGAIEWTGFDLSAPNSVRYTAQGSSVWNNLASTGSTSDRREANFVYYQKTQGLDIIDEMNDTNFQSITIYHPAGFVDKFIMEFNGSFEGELGGGHVLNANTEGEFTVSSGTDEEGFIQAGQINVRSSDGASMRLDAKGVQDRVAPLTTPLVDWTNTAADGTTASGNGAVLGSFSSQAPRCQADDSQQPIICDDGGFAYSLP